MDRIESTSGDGSDDFLIGYSRGYAEVAESVELGDIYEAQIYINELDEAGISYRLGFKQGVMDALSGSMK